MRLGGVSMLLVATLALAGCLSDAGGNTDLSGTGEASPTVGEAPSAPLVQTWDGHMVIGAAAEAPAHFAPSDDLVRPIWSTGLVVEVSEAPDLFEISVDWTSTGPTSIMFMVHAPHGAERANEPGWSEYSTHGSDELWASQGPLCMRIPAADLEEDVANVAKLGGHPYWYPMVHSYFGVDVQLTVTVTSVGGNVSIPAAVHGHETSAEEIMEGAQTELGPKRSWEPCELGTA